MSLRAGPYTFNHVTYDEASDVLYAAIVRPEPGERRPTPEEHVLRFDERGRFSGIVLVSPREQLEREGGVFISLPDGSRTRVQGFEPLLRGSR
ncbi:DUF2283 domain-containing protein [Thermoleophilia bacterium SCSIO 60948]|nr:DUF2283 domain-containing protein [Thermoleophilia bacterium SCSIO 60948]